MNQPRVKIGCCGWSYLRPAEFNITQYNHTLEAYARLFNSVEINSTFYKIPMPSTVENWRRLADSVNKDFEFTVKCSQLITHKARFGDTSFDAYEQMADICKALCSKLLLFQSPAGFLPSDKNIQNMRKFFKRIKKDNIILVWEPRGKWYDETSKIIDICKGFNLIHCVDPLRDEPLYFGSKKIAYFRLHGFGIPTMYNYTFSQEELKSVKEKIDGLKNRINTCYIFFNNATCYNDGMRFLRYYG